MRAVVERHLRSGDPSCRLPARLGSTRRIRRPRSGVTTPPKQSRAAIVQGEIWDPDNSCGATQTLFYDWTILTTPLRGSSARLRPGATGRTVVLDTQDNGEYRVRLIVRDSTGRSSTEVVCFVNVSNAG